MGIYYAKQEDYVTAKEYFERAVESGLPLEYYGLGYVYALGSKDVEKDLDKAYELFDKTKETGYIETIYNVGKL